MSRLSNLTLLFCLAVFAFACEDDDDVNPGLTDDAPTDVTGLNFATTTAGVAAANFSAVYGSLVRTLEQNTAISIVAEVDHRANAINAGSDLNNTSLVLFGNPALGTPLMQANQQAGIDLPQRILVYSAGNGDIISAYNNTEFIGRRHGVSNVGTLGNIASALQGLASQGGAVPVTAATLNDVSLNQGLIRTGSALGVADVHANLLELIGRNSALSLIADLDHQANAASVDLDLRPTRLVVFGNPTLGTPLIQDRRTAAFDLPQKMLIYEDEAGNTQILYNDIDFIVERHGIDTDLEEIAMIRMALANIAATIAAE